MAQTYLDSITPRERARHGRQPELSIWEISVETFPSDPAKQKNLAEFLVAAVTAKTLTPAPGWESRTHLHEPFPQSVFRPPPSQRRGCW